jgi:hypothetical protein
MCYKVPLYSAKNPMQKLPKNPQKTHPKNLQKTLKTYGKNPRGL